MAQPHWKSYNVRANGVDDLTLLSKFSEQGIIENLNKRYDSDIIFTYIGPVLISVNPFKKLPYFTQKEVDIYQGAASFENPPHIYALADNMYRNLTIDNESQSVIISGESGAGKTVAAKFVMNYISTISGGGANIQQVKEVIIKSNPLLEAFGNAKTLRNNNSSRFGKFFQISFTGGTPVGGKIQEFLLEKSRVVAAGVGERNFHIFYQLVKGEESVEVRRSLGLEGFQCADFNYLASTNEYDADEMNDQTEYHETMNAMRTMGMQDEEIESVFSIVSSILHIGNIHFDENDREVGFVVDDSHIDFPAYLLGFNKAEMHNKLLTHRMETKWGKSTEVINVQHSKVKAYYTRDSLAKAIYERLFTYLIRRVNEAIPNSTNLNLGVLDIYGFEIFRKNGFEQFCINYVNEKLQQLFIELTLKAEQEEYQREGIQWTPIDFFNNIVVLDLIEGKRPPGLISITDDVTKQVGNKEDGVGETLVGKLRAGCGTNSHFGDQGLARFKIMHYAGEVSYDADGFIEKNRDTVFIDLLEMCKTSQNAFIQELFADLDLTKKQTTSGTKIRTQSNTLIAELVKTQPHYIRTIKPNESKQPNDWNQSKVGHQVKYLGLMENVRVRRAGFAYRRIFAKFLQRYSILTFETFREWRHGTGRGDPRSAVQAIMQSVNMEREEWQCGRSKVFIKSPESLFLLEEQRERKYNVHARVIQKAWKKYAARRKTNTEATEAAQLLGSRKERNRLSISRQFIGDYLGLDHDDNADISKHLGRRDRVLFACKVAKYNRKFLSARRDLIVTETYLYVIGKRPIGSGDSKSTKKKKLPPNTPLESFVEEKIELQGLEKISMSPYQDGYVLIHVQQRDKPILIQLELKTEMCWAINKALRRKFNKALHLCFEQEFLINVEASGYFETKGWKKVKPRHVVFQQLHGQGIKEDKETQKYCMIVQVPPGAPPNTMPSLRQPGKSQGGGKRNPQSNRPSHPPAHQPAHQQSRQPAHHPSEHVEVFPPPMGSRNHGNFPPPLTVAPVQSYNPPMQQEAVPRWNEPGKHDRNRQSIQNSNYNRHRIMVQPGNDSSNKSHSYIPPNQPANHFRLPSISNETGPTQRSKRRPSGRDHSAPTPQRDQTIKNRFNEQLNQDQSFLNQTPNLPEHFQQQVSIQSRPAPSVRAKPRVAPKPRMYPTATVMFEYTANDNDEISLAEGDMVEILNEDASGWWKIKNRGQEGLFPGNYLQKN